MQDSISTHCPSQLPKGPDKSFAELQLEADSLSLGKERPWALVGTSCNVRSVLVPLQWRPRFVAWHVSAQTNKTIFNRIAHSQV